MFSHVFIEFREAGPRSASAAWIAASGREAVKSMFSDVFKGLERPVRGPPGCSQGVLEGRCARG